MSCMRCLINLVEAVELSAIKLSRWNDVPRTSRIFLSQIATISQFYVYLNVT